MVIDPLFWLGLSFLLVSVSLTAVLVALVPAVRELSRAARSVEKLCDTISRELPPTLESIRLTSLEITELTDDVTGGVQNATRVAQQIDQSVGSIRQQAQQVQVGTRSFAVGVRAAWRTLMRQPGRDRRRLAASKAPAVNSLKSHPDTASSNNPAKPSSRSGSNAASSHGANHFSPNSAQADGHPPSPLPELPSGKTSEPNRLPPKTASQRSAEAPENTY